MEFLIVITPGSYVTVLIQNHNEIIMQEINDLQWELPALLI